MTQYLPGGTGKLPTKVKVSTGSVSAAGTADVSVTWPAPYASADLTVVASVLSDHAGDGLIVRRVRSVSTTGCVVHVANEGLMARTGVVHVIVDNNT